MCGVQGVKAATENEDVMNIVDLRAEANEGVINDHPINWVHIPLVDGTSGQTEPLQKAITFVSNAYKSGETTIFH